MRTIETQVFTYSELSESAKASARDWYRESSAGDDFFAEYVYDDAATIGDIIGIDLRRTRKTGGDGSPVYTPTIFYSGFCSQGDGACFESIYRYKKGALSALRAHIGGESKGDRELLRICEGLQDVQRKYFYHLQATTRHIGHYYHSGCMAVSVDHPDYSYREIGDAESEVTQLLRDFADWIYDRLETAYDWENSDANVAENIDHNGYEFTEEGATA
jgi:hypothetical protein